MPLPAAAIPAIIAGGSSILGSGINAVAQGSMNRKTRAFSREMYDRQRQDALADWLLQNQYNHPTQQMARLREAGLNPALVYGNGAVTTANPVRSSQVEAWNPRAPQIDLAGAAGMAISAYLDTKVKEAQVDNLTAQNSVLAQEKFLKAAQVLATLASTDKTKTDTESTRFDLDLKNRLKDASIASAELDVEKKKADIKFTLDSNERAAALQASNLKEAAVRILKMRAETATTEAQRQEIQHRIHNLEKQGEQTELQKQLMQLDIDLKEKGVQPGDDIWWRALARLLETGSINIPKNWLDRLRGLSAQ